MIEVSFSIFFKKKINKYMEGKFCYFNIQSNSNIHIENNKDNSLHESIIKTHLVKQRIYF